MKEINLTQGLVALVDDKDFKALNRHKWNALKHGDICYAVRTIAVSGKRTSLYMHVEIMGKKGIDHIDHNGLNNQRNNLRFCTVSENMMNRSKQENASSIYKGVCFHKITGKWMAHIRINGKRIHLGLFISEVDAAKAYNAKAIELFCGFAHLNIILSEE